MIPQFHTSRSQRSSGQVHAFTPGPYYYPQLPGDWQARSWARRTWGAEVRTGGGSCCQLIRGSSKGETSPVSTLIGCCCHDVFKFRQTPPPKHASTHAPPGINLPWGGGRKVCLLTSWEGEGGRGAGCVLKAAAARRPGGREAPLLPARSAGQHVRALRYSALGAQGQG